MIRRHTMAAISAGLVLLAARAASAGPADWNPSPEPAAVRAAVQDLMESFPGRYPNGAAYLARLADLEKQLAAADPGARQKAHEGLVALQREALLANPLVAGKTLLFVSRSQYPPDHHNTETIFQKDEVNTGSFAAVVGSAIKTVNLATGAAAAVLNVPQGVARDPEVSFDGRSLLLSVRWKQDDDYHIYRVNVDGSGLSQLTFGEFLSDLEPIHMPDGGIVFGSTREPKYCHCNRHIQTNLFRMDGDGANIVQLGRNQLWEGHPSLMPDGRVLYGRWEYVDRHFGPSEGLWTMNPDGTNQALFCGNNSWAPGGMMDGRGVPGTPLVVAVYSGCHERPWGSVALIDRRRGMDGSPPVVQFWPPRARDFFGEPSHDILWEPGRIDAFGCVSHHFHIKYEDPRPLADAATGAGAGKYFLVSRSVSSQYRMAGFLVDTFGNEVLLCDDPKGVFDLQIVQPRPVPPVIPDRVDYRKPTGLFYVTNVYQGTRDEMKGVAPGAIKYLRIVEATQKRAWSNAGYGIDAAQIPAMNWNCTIGKRILGDVPVEADGSAYFEVPADRYVFFQALDEKKMMVQSMRSGTMVRPGELAGCGGCHENRLSSPTVPRVPAAVRRAPSRLGPWYGPERDFNYLTEVQPVFDRNCVRCHDYGKPGAARLNLCGDLDAVFNKSYRELHARSAVRWSPEAPGQPKRLINVVHDGPPAVLPAYAWGSHRSRLVDVVRGGHNNVRLSREDFERIVTWIDMNGVYYGAYTTCYRDNPFGRAPLTNHQYGQLSALVGEVLPPTGHPAMPVNFTRPELSECLAKLRAADPNGETCRKALAIIQAGKDQLARQPREDMLGPRAVPISAEDVERHQRYLAQVQAEENARKAVLAGTKVYPFKK